MATANAEPSAQNNNFFLSATRSFKRSASDAFWVGLAKAFLVAGNAALFLLMARWLSVESFGQLATVAGGQALLGRLILFGAEQGMIRLRSTPGYANRTHRVDGAALALVLAASAICGTALLAFSEALESFGIRDTSLLTAFLLWIGGFGSALVDLGYWWWLARLRYRAAAATSATLVFGRLVLMVSAVSVAPASGRALFAYSAATCAAGLAQLWIMWTRGAVRPCWGTATQLLRYSAWQGGAVVLGTLVMYEGMFLLSWLGQKGAAGIFGFAITATVAFTALYAGASEYLMSRVVQVQNGAGLRRFLLRASGACLLLVTACVPLIAAAGWALPRIIRPELWGTGMVFYYLSAAAMLFILHVPLEAACHWFLRPDWILWSKAARVIAIAVLGWMLAHLPQAIGVAEAQFAGTALVFVVFLCAVGFAVLRHPANEGPTRRAERDPIALHV